jgi:small subunit ribosomal protein S16
MSQIHLLPLIIILYYKFGDEGRLAAVRWCKIMTDPSKTMIKLRLKRFGKKNQSSFRLVAVNSTSRRDGKPLEELGYYNPSTKESKLNVDNIRSRIAAGAQPTDTVKSFLLKAGIISR